MWKINYWERYIGTRSFLPIREKGEKSEWVREKYWQRETKREKDKERQIIREKW